MPFGKKPIITQAVKTCTEKKNLRNCKDTQFLLFEIPGEWKILENYQDKKASLYE